MGILTIATLMTLDGVMQAPGGPDEDRDRGFEHGGWSFPYAGDDMREVIGDAFGRADCFNTLPKYVVSTTLANTEWEPTTIIRGDVAVEVAKLKDRYDGEIQVHGSAALAQTLHARGLIDEYRLFIEPVVLGTGKRLFEPGAAPTALQLVEAEPMDKGAVLATYRPAGKPTYGEFQMEEGLGLVEI